MVFLQALCFVIFFSPDAFLFFYILFPEINWLKLSFKIVTYDMEIKDVSILERLKHEERKPVDLILEEIEKQE